VEWLSVLAIVVASLSAAFTLLQAKAAREAAREAKEANTQARRVANTPKLTAQWLHRQLGEQVVTLTNWGPITLDEVLMDSATFGVAQVRLRTLAKTSQDGRGLLSNFVVGDTEHLVLATTRQLHDSVLLRFECRSGGDTWTIAVPVQDQEPAAAHGLGADPRTQARPPALLPSARDVEDAGALCVRGLADYQPVMRERLAAANRSSSAPRDEPGAAV
jgi:hypothetical protein